ncbi:MAG: Flp pilus assembly complex ATPase component TadA [Desulfurococcales archaeon]|nr:Flp pilus assembly complex ATPase component TadA [Desulfurococcales archaeon]
MKGVLSKLKSAFKRRKEESANQPLVEPLEAEEFSEIPRIAERAQKLIKAKMRPLDLYPLYQPWAYAHIVEDLKTGNIIYLVEEVSLNKREAEVFKEIIDYITWELEPPKGSVDLHDYILAYARKALRLFQIRLGRTPGLSWSKIGYYIERDLLGYGKLDPIFRDENIEDISCNGPRKPVYVWHRKYESLPTNIVFATEDELDEYVLKLAHMAGKHISVAYPILDAILPGGHRVAATFQKEVSTSGSTFTIRKFREDPITIIDMINFGTISSELAAYFWLAMDYKMTSLILGVTGAGKSVSGSTKVLAVVKGVPGVYSVDEIWEALRDNAFEVFDGAEIIFDPDVLIRTCDPDTLKCVWAKPRTFLKHRNDKRMVRVRFRSGRYVDVTEDHSLIVAKDGRLLPSLPSKEIIGLYSPIPLNPIPRTTLTLDTSLSFLKGKHTYAVIDDRLRNLFRKAVEKLGLEEVLKLLNYRSKSSLRTQRKIRIDRLRNLLKRISVYDLNILVCGRTGTPARLDIIGSVAFAELLGLYLAEGFSNEHVVAIAMSNPEKPLNLCKALTGECSLQRPKGKVPLVVIKGTLASLIRDLSIGMNAEKKRIPPLYWVMPQEWKAAFLRGYIAGDGYLKRKELELTTASKELSWELIFALSELGIHARISSKLVNGKTYFRVFIPKSQYLKLIKLRAIPENKLRGKQLEGQTPTYGWSKYDNILSELLLGNPEAKRVLRKISKHGPGLMMLRFYEGKAITRAALRKLIRMSSLAGEEVEALTNLLEAPVGFDKIVSVEEIPPEPYVYDFEVPETQTFEGNNVILHNTSTLNALANLLRPTYKVVTIEDTPELRLPQENWVQLVSRPSYLAGGGVGEITLFHLVKVSLRYRPDVIVVGEVRGEEAYVLFQAIASVSWDTPILLRDPEGRVSLTPIGHFIDSFYEEGEERVAKKVQGYAVLSHDGFKAVWKPVKYVLRHKVDEIYVVRYEGGGKIKATGSHSVFVLNPETLEITEKPVKELKPGDLLVTFVRNPEGSDERHPRIDVIDAVGNPEKDFVDNIPKYMKAVTGRNPVKLATYLSLERDRATRKNLRIRRRRVKGGIPAVITLDEDLAFVFGAYTADGSVHRHRGSYIVFSFGKEEKGEIADKVMKIMKSKFGLEPTVIDRGSYILIQYNNTLLAELFANLLGRVGPEKKVPQALWEASVPVVKAFFEGLKADARRTLKRRYTSYTTAYLRLAQDLVWLARTKGFYASLHEEEGSGKNLGKTYYTVNVYLNKEYIKPNTSEKIPAEAILNLIRKSESKSMPYKLTYIRRRKYISKKKANEIIEWVTKKGKQTPEVKELIRRITSLINGDLTAVEVKEVERTPYEGYVYDVSVPGTESFFGGNVPVLLHNTGHSGMTTLHAESIDAAVKRLTSPPMNIPPSYIPLVNFALVIKRLVMHKEGGKPRPVRRITNVWEIRDYGQYDEVARWDPVRDIFELNVKDSIILKKIGEMTGKGVGELIEEISRRKAILEWLATNNIRSYKQVATYVQRYYLDAEGVLKDIGAV